MLSFSTKSIYGLKAVLALATHYDQGLLQIREIAARQDIPRQYLEQIFNQLGKAGIIQSVRGKNGGYRLARAPGEITAAEVISLLEGGIELVKAVSDPADVVAELFAAAQEKLLASLHVTLAELALRQEARRNILNYEI